MPLGLTSTEEFDAELLRFNGNNGKPNVIIEHGRGPKSETPQAIRELVASEALSGASAKELAETFNVSESSVSAYKHNATSTSTYHNPDEKLKKSNDKVKDSIVGSAQDKLKAALEAIVFTDGIKPNIASAVARDMSGIIKNLNPTPDMVINNQQVLVYKPRMKEEDAYEVIDVRGSE